MVPNNKKTLLDTTRLICQSSLLSTHSLRHIRLSRCKALLSHHFTRTFALALSHCLAPCLTLSFTQEAFFFSYVSLGSLDAAMTGHHLPMTAKPRGARSNPFDAGDVSAGGRASQSLLHFSAGESVSLHYLLHVFLLFTLQNAQEVLQLRHGEGMPL